jgi:hypothetical protein
MMPRDDQAKSTTLADFPVGRLDLYLTDIGEPLDNELRAVICEAVLGAETNIVDDHFKIENVRPMEVTAESRSFELYWESYVAYAVRNESYWKQEIGEPDFENHLRRRFDSAFLQYVSATTFADDDEYLGPLQHWTLSTLNHCLDVVSTEPPRVRPLDVSDVVRLPSAINFSKG